MRYVLVAPIWAVPKCLAKQGIDADAVDLFEINEAFSGSTLAALRELELDPARVNVNGGAVALGHPIGASGCRVLVTLLHELIRQDKQTGLASLCLGGGEAVAMVVTRP
jgi:acetyl-CoA C-acetyltransferase